MDKWYINITGVVAGIIGGILLLIFFFWIQMGIFSSALMGVAGFTGAYLVIYSFKPVQKIIFQKGSEVTPELLETTLQEGNDKIKVLEDYSKQIENEQVRKKIKNIIVVVRKIFANFEKDPKDIKYAKQFLSYYFDATIRIVKKYIDLASQQIRSAEIDRALSKAEGMLDSIEQAFQKQQAKILRDDVMDLDVEIETLEKTFMAEDLK